MAAPAEDQDVLTGFEATEEVTHEGRLADPRGAADEHRARSAALGDLIGAFEGVELDVSTDEARAASGGGADRDAGHRRRTDAWAEGLEDLLPRRSICGQATEQLHAEIGEVGWRAGCNRLRVERGVAVLSQELLQAGAGEGEASRECLVEHDADGVPVGFRPERIFAGLLRSHVRGRADDAALFGGGLLGDGLELGDEAEVEDDDAAGLGDEHVGRLDVPVQAPGGVQRAEAFGELPERDPEASQVHD